MFAVGLLIEEHREKIIDSWRAAALKAGTPVLEFAMPVFVHELARALRHGLTPERAWDRCALLARRAGDADPGAVVRELAVLRRVLWTVLREHKRAVPPEARMAVDTLLDDTMAALVEAIVVRA